MSSQCQFITQSLQCKCYFCYLLKGFSLSDKAVDTRHPGNLLCSTSVISWAFSTLSTEFLGPCYIFPRIFPIALTPSKIAKLLIALLADYLRYQMTELLFFPRTLILDRPLVLKSILQILQKSLGTMLVSFSGVFIPGLLLGNTAANYPANSVLDPD